MKLSFDVEMNREEVAMFKANQLFMMKTLKDTPNLGKFLEGANVDDIIEKSFAPISMEMSCKNIFGAFLYKTRLKDTITMNVSLELGEEHFQYYLDLQKFFFNLGLPVVDSVVGIFMNMRIADIKNDLKEIQDKYKPLMENISTDVKIRQGDDVE